MSNPAVEIEEPTTPIRPKRQGGRYRMRAALTKSYSKNKSGVRGHRSAVSMRSEDNAAEVKGDRKEHLKLRKKRAKLERREFWKPESRRSRFMEAWPNLPKGMAYPPEDLLTPQFLGEFDEDLAKTSGRVKGAQNEAAYASMMVPRIKRLAAEADQAMADWIVNRPERQEARRVARENEHLMGTYSPRVLTDFRFTHAEPIMNPTTHRPMSAPRRGHYGVVSLQDKIINAYDSPFGLVAPNPIISAFNSEFYPESAYQQAGHQIYQEMGDRRHLEEQSENRRVFRRRMEERGESHQRFLRVSNRIPTLPPEFLPDFGQWQANAEAMNAMEAYTGTEQDKENFRGLHTQFNS